MRVLATLTGITFVLGIQGSLFGHEPPKSVQPPFSQTALDQLSAEQTGQARLDEAQLDQLVAPIALYPDPVLAQVLIASTYPLEVVQAERWLGKNVSLKGDALTTALSKKNGMPASRRSSKSPTSFDDERRS